jgi:hypothetical protein
MEDRIESIGKGSIIQHGKLNNRIYLITLGKKDVPDILDSLRQLALQEGYTKIFCKVPEWAAPLFFCGWVHDRGHHSRDFYQGEVQGPSFWPSTWIRTGS